MNVHYEVTPCRYNKYPRLQAENLLVLHHVVPFFFSPSVLVPTYLPFGEAAVSLLQKLIHFRASVMRTTMSSHKQGKVDIQWEIVHSGISKASSQVLYQLAISSKLFQQQ